MDRTGNLPSVGIVGTKDQITILTPILKSIGFPVTAIWSRDSQETRQLAERYEIPYCAPSFQDLLLQHNVQLVYVATEPALQAEVAVKALTSGKHCICQKPPSVSQSEVEKMFILSQYYSQLHCLIECHHRFLPCFVKLRDLVLNNYIGVVMSIDVRVMTGSLFADESYSWKCDPRMGGGVLNQIGSHLVDIICYVNGRNCTIRRVNCLLKTFQPQNKLICGYRSSDSDDYCSLQMECSNQSVATVLINSCWPSESSFEFLVTGSKKQLVVKGLDLFCSGPEMKTLHKQDVRNIDDLETGTFPGQYQSAVIGCTELLKTTARLFRGQEESCLATFKDGLHVRTVLDSARQSHRLSQWVDIPIDTGIPSNMSNPFWTTSSMKTETDKYSPKLSHRMHI